MKKYKHLFWDLDRTLWDFDRNSEEAIRDLYEKHDLLSKLGVEFGAFFQEYLEINHKLWAVYRIGQIPKDELRLKRFHNTFKLFNYDNPVFALSFNDDYVALCSSKPNLIPHSKEVLDYLKPNYEMHVITNGFVEAQQVKINNSGLDKYFTEVVVSDGLGYRKPDKRIFDYAFEKSGATAENSIMIGDDYGPDVLGAKEVGMDQVYFTKELQKDEAATFVIHSLLELKNIL
ncbi:YjjG family noncanonical pyrimidine nucleotidase [Vicingaceae bacterium]|nr:YjjG family noncanonical pyrimidine nucleotidase [Vicingaceae bacterium]MDA9782884.1 YjjG family noncanonical pyrimidine nucleotidase [Vicingaceae bacterium]MDB4061766.1 YjjG family noncanonical pyrimidine nucleotidase [Vicingaceae bacterium]MDB4082779.1 YjjG family noncanonical pyrimidine nucleotidase [Vicingaceae bacterium]MDC1451790.1 YjjG family noncanonical pyrimidine nucleotidase [Vicingaceae bacterium]